MLSCMAGGMHYHYIRDNLVTFIYGDEFIPDGITEVSKRPMMTVPFCIVEIFYAPEVISMEMRNEDFGDVSRTNAMELQKSP